MHRTPTVKTPDRLGSFGNAAGQPSIRRKLVRCLAAVSGSLKPEPLAPSRFDVKRESFARQPLTLG